MEEEQDTQETEESEASEYPFMGTLIRAQAKLILMRRPRGTWLLRNNEDGEVRISIKLDTKVSHMKIHKSPEGYFLNSGNLPAPFDDVIAYLIETQLLSPHPLTINEAFSNTS